MLNLGSGKTFMVSIGRFGIAGHFANDPETQEMIRKGYKGLRPGILDPIKRIDDQNMDGVDAEVLLPSVLFGINTIPNADIVAATYKNYNDWIVQLRLAGARSASSPPLRPAARHRRWRSRSCTASKAMGHVGANIPCVPPPDKPYSDPLLRTFWAAAEELEMPLVMHFLTSTQPNHGLPDGMAMGTGYGLGRLRHAARHRRHHRGRRLRALPQAQVRDHGVGDGLDRPLPPAHGLGLPRPLPHQAAGADRAFSFYWHQNFLGTFEDDRVGLDDALRHRRAQPHVGQRLPPPRLDLPALARLLDDIFEGIPDEDRYRSRPATSARSTTCPSRGRQPAGQSDDR